MKKIFSIICLLFLLSGCTNVEKENKNITILTDDVTVENPFLEESYLDSVNISENYMKKKYNNAFSTIQNLTLTVNGYSLDEINNVLDKGEYDVLKLPYETYLKLDKEKYFANLTKVINSYTRVNPLILNDPIISGIDNGVNYGVGSDAIIFPEALVFDNKKLKEAGMIETPLDIWNNGNWDWETATIYFQKLQEKLPSSTNIWMDNTGYFKQNQLGTSGSTSPSTEFDSYINNLVESGIVKFGEGESVFKTISTNPNMDTNEFKDFGFVPFPIKSKLPKENYASYARPEYIYVVNKNSKNIDEAGKTTVFLNAQNNTFFYEKNISPTELYTKNIFKDSAYLENYMVSEYLLTKLRLNDFNNYKKGEK